MSIYEDAIEKRDSDLHYTSRQGNTALCVKESVGSKARESDVSGFERMRERDGLICNFLPCPVRGHVTAFSKAVVGSLPVSISVCVRACICTTTSALSLSPLLEELKMLSELPLDLFSEGDSMQQEALLSFWGW